MKNIATQSAALKSGFRNFTFQEIAVDTIRLLAYRLDLFRQFGQPNSDLYFQLFAGADLDKSGRAPGSDLKAALLKLLHGRLVLELSNTDGGLSKELAYAERNAREEEKERIEKEWYENERSRAATADADEAF